MIETLNWKILDLTEQQLCRLCEAASREETKRYRERLTIHTLGHIEGMCRVTPSAEWTGEEEEAFQDWMAIRQELDRLYLAHAQAKLDEARKR